MEVERCSMFATHGPGQHRLKAGCSVQQIRMEEYEDDNLGFGIFKKVDKNLGLSRGTAWDASGWKDYCDFGFGDV